MVYELCQQSIIIEFGSHLEDAQYFRTRATIKLNLLNNLDILLWYYSYRVKL